MPFFFGKQVGNSFEIADIKSVNDIEGDNKQQHAETLALGQQVRLLLRLRPELPGGNIVIDPGADDSDAHD